MAGRVMNQSKRMVTYFPNVRAILQHVRAFSSGDKRLPPTDRFEYDFDDLVEENKLFLSAKEKQFFPLPGNIGYSKQLPIKQEKKESEDRDVLTDHLLLDRHKQTIFQAFSNEKDELEAKKSHTSHGCNILECTAQECSPKEFADLFPDRDITTSPFTVVTVSQKTKKDMSEWSAEVETEREDLMKTFVMIADSICSKLKEAGFWAEFIDPYSGTPFLGGHTNSTLFETDERYGQFGFNIEDLGCCKVIKHHLWGSHVYVGCLFTNAPADDRTLRLLLEPLRV